MNTKVARHKRKSPPIDPAKSRMLLRQKGFYQKDLADGLKITQGAVAHYLDGHSYSERFWNYFYDLVGLKKAS